MVEKGKPDKVILSSGARPVIPRVPGIDSDKVMLAEDVLLGKKDPGQRVVIAGGGMVGTETAAFVGMQCKDKVTIIEPRENVAMDLEAGIRDDLKDVLRREYVDIITGASLAGITGRI